MKRPRPVGAASSGESDLAARCRVEHVDGELELRFKLPEQLVQGAGVLRQAKALAGSSGIDCDAAGVFALLAWHLARVSVAQGFECLVLQVRSALSAFTVTWASLCCVKCLFLVRVVGPVLSRAGAAESCASPSNNRVCPTGLTLNAQPN